MLRISEMLVKECNRTVEDPDPSGGLAMSLPPHERGPTMETLMIQPEGGTFRAYFTYKTQRPTTT